MIYVDDLMQYGKLQWCHMITDGDIEELHEFAQKIGLKREWFQNPPSKRPHPHYDLRPTKRALAIRYGANPITRKELVKIMLGKYEKMLTK